MNSLEIGHLLSSLVTKNILLALRKGRWTSYRLNTDYIIPGEQLQVENVSLSSEISFKNDTDKIIYQYIVTNGFITSPQILGITKIKTSQGANVALGRLMSANLIKKVRKGRQFIYELK
jgi:predicted transcriptional regulator